MTEQDAGAETGSAERISEGLIEKALALLPRSVAAIIDRDLRIVKAFGEGLTLRDYDPASMVGLSVADAFPGKPVSELEPAIVAAFGGEDRSIELPSSDGLSRYQIEIRPMFEGAGVVAVLGFVTDITARWKAEQQVSEEKRFFENVLDSIGHMISVKDSERRVLHLNRNFEKYTGISQAEAIGRPMADFFDPEFAQRFADDDSEVLEKGRALRTEREVPAADGSPGTYLTERAPLRRADGSVYGVVTVGVDVSEKISAERELADAKKLFEAAFTNAPNGMALVGLDGSFLRVNPAMSDLTGYPEEELTKLKVADITRPDDMKEQVDLVRRALSGEFESYSLEKRFTRKSGEAVWLVLAVSLVRDDSGKAFYVVVQTTNISERKQLEIELRNEIGLDPLTGLANRREVESALETVLENCRRDGSRAVLLIVDFDHFKEINDRFGHAVGDGMLSFIAEELRGRIRSTDLAGRIGGDEFVVLLEGVGPEPAQRIARGLTEHFDRVAYDPEGLNLRCPASVGSAVIDADSRDPQEVLRQADLAMYEVKRSRRPA